MGKSIMGKHNLRSAAYEDPSTGKYVKLPIMIAAAAAIFMWGILFRKSRGKDREEKPGAVHPRELLAAAAEKRTEGGDKQTPLGELMTVGREVSRVGAAATDLLAASGPPELQALGVLLEDLSIQQLKLDSIRVEASVQGSFGRKMEEGNRIRRLMQKLESALHQRSVDDNEEEGRSEGTRF